MDTEDSFQAHLDANPADGLARMVFADWLEENKDARAAGYRELGRLGLYPVCHKYNKGFVKFVCSQASSEAENYADVLPTQWWLQLLRLSDFDATSPTNNNRAVAKARRRDLEDLAAFAFLLTGR